MDLRAEDEAVDARLGARLAHRFGGDARRLAHAARLLVLTSDELRGRTLLYRPAPFPGGTGAVVMPSSAPPSVATAMLGVAVGLHLDGTALPSSYADGVLVGPRMPRHRAAARFARGFVSVAAARPLQEVAPRAGRRAS